MEEQQRLFEPLPSHIAVGGHWTPRGWELSLWWSSGTDEARHEQRTLYSHLSTPELVDVIGEALSTILRL